mgnify:CR=1 FL=1
MRSHNSLNEGNYAAQSNNRYIGEKMINKLKSKAMHYWSDHKIECLVVAVLVIAYIVK